MKPTEFDITPLNQEAQLPLGQEVVDEMLRPFEEWDAALQEINANGNPRFYRGQIVVEESEQEGDVRFFKAHTEYIHTKTGVGFTISRHYTTALEPVLSQRVVTQSSTDQSDDKYLRIFKNISIWLDANTDEQVLAFLQNGASNDSSDMEVFENLLKIKAIQKFYQTQGYAMAEFGRIYIERIVDKHIKSLIPRGKVLTYQLDNFSFAGETEHYIEYPKSSPEGRVVVVVPITTWMKRNGGYYQQVITYVKTIVGKNTNPPSYRYSLHRNKLDSKAKKEIRDNFEYGSVAVSAEATRVYQGGAPGLGKNS